MIERGRAVLADQPGEPMRLTVYRPDGAPVSVEVDPLRALALAADLVEGARRRVGEPS